MAKKKKGRTGDLIAELIHQELQAQLNKLVRKAKKKANREAGKLNDMLRLEYHKEYGFTEAEIIDELPEMEGVSMTMPIETEGVKELKKTEDGHQE